MASKELSQVKTSYFSDDESFPFVKMGESAKYRGNTIQYVSVHPIQYDQLTNTVRIIDKLRYTLEFAPFVSSNPDDGYNMNTFDDPFMENVFLNYRPESSSSKITSNTHMVKDYLIITTPKFESEAKRFARWKRIMGYNAQIVSHEQWTPQSTREAIQNFARENPNLYYLLIVGRNKDVPESEVGSNLNNDGYYISDFLYSCLDDDDFPDIYIGRIPVTNVEDAKIVFDKIISYEKNPPNSEEFYKKGIHASYFEVGVNEILRQKSEYDPLTKESSKFILTSEICRSYMINIGKDVSRVYYADENIKPIFFNNGDELPEDLKNPNYSWNGNAADISNLINKGAFYVLYKSHGDIRQWSYPKYLLSDIYELKNSLMPVVFSMTCLTGTFSAKANFAEEFLKHDKGGCVAIIAASAVSSHWGSCELTNQLFKLIEESTIENADLQYKGSSFSISQLLSIALQKAIANGDVSKYVKYDQKIYNCFGDPSMIFLTEKPYSPEEVNIVQTLSNLTVSVPYDEVKIVICDENNEIVKIYTSNDVSFDMKGGDYSVAIIANGMRPVVYEHTASNTLKIQNEIIDNNRNYNVDKIIVGCDVIEDMPKGDVEFVKGSINLVGTVFLTSGVSINKGVNFKIAP